MKSLAPKLCVLVLLVTGSVAAGVFSGQPEEDSPDKVVFFRDRILPLLKQHCFRCHSEQGEKVEADLRLDTREGLLRGGDQGPAVEPGEPDQSLLMTAVRYETDDLKMPPDRKLEDQQLADLEKWIRWGVPYEK